MITSQDWFEIGCVANLLQLADFSDMTFLQLREETRGVSTLREQVETSGTMPFSLCGAIRSNEDRMLFGRDLRGEGLAFSCRYGT